LVVNAVELAHDLRDLIRAVQVEGSVAVLLDGLGVIECVRREDAA
jgi:hypothetical protein